MTKRVIVDCDRCDRKNIAAYGHITGILNRYTSAAGDTAYDWLSADLCPDCLAYMMNWTMKTFLTREQIKEIKDTFIRKNG